MGFAECIGPCCGCGEMITFNPNKVPSLRVHGNREPLCRVCFGKWNEIHRVSKGLPPEPLAPDAYSPIPESDL